MVKTAVITGGSSGIGFELAKICAKNGYALILIAKEADNLHNAKNELQLLTNSTVTLLVKDLSNQKNVEEIYEYIEKNQIEVDILINNAGFATYGLFSELEAETELKEIEVNIKTLTYLTKLLLPNMIKRKSGKILNISSTAAFQPGPLMAVYYASKAYVLSFSEALSFELRGSGVTVTTLCPGPTKTNFVKRAKMEKSKLFDIGIMDAQSVAKMGFEGMMNGQIIVVPGLRNKLHRLIVNYIPINLLLKLVFIAQKPR